MKHILLPLFFAGMCLFPNIVMSQNAKDTQPDPAAAPYVVYYFYSAPRCSTCEAIEKLTADAIQNRFAAELEAGRLDWKLIDIGKDPNKHYIETYSLYTKSVVVARMEDGKPVDFKILQEVWELVHKPDAFGEYIEEEVRRFMKGPNE